MYKIADGIYDALSKLEKHPEKILDREFMMSVFEKWIAGNPAAKKGKGLTYGKGRGTNTVGNTATVDQVFVMKEGLALIFNRNALAINDTDKDTQTLGLIAMVRFTEEMLSQKTGKQTRQFMSCVKGGRSWKMVSATEKDASVGRESVNDIGEAHFAATKNEKQTYGANLSTLSAGGVATAKTT